jgi:hypothetical protein
VPGVSYRVDVKTKKLVQLEAGSAKGAAVASLQPFVGDPRAARTVVVHTEVHPERKEKS